MNERAFLPDACPSCGWRPVDGEICSACNSNVRPGTDAGTLAATIRGKLLQFVPRGFRYEDGVWHVGPHLFEADAALSGLVALVEQRERLANEEHKRAEAADALLARCQQALERIAKSNDPGARKVREFLASLSGTEESGA